MKLIVHNVFKDANGIEMVTISTVEDTEVKKNVTVEQVVKTLSDGVVSISNKEEFYTKLTELRSLKSDKENKKLELRSLINTLNKARYSYEQLNTEIMSNKEYDELYDKLAKLEAETGIRYSDSPTINVGYEVVSKLEKKQHDSSMLSLDKTKDVSAIAQFCGNNECVTSWKMDGLTVVVTYNNGKLVEAVTRGNGEIGEVVTHNAKRFKNLPETIPYKNKLVVRGEAVITYPDFEAIKRSSAEAEEYKNPRNLCSGSVRTLDSKVSSSRNVRFYGFKLVNWEEIGVSKYSGQLAFLEDTGFDVVQHMVHVGKVESVVKAFESAIDKCIIPTDGLVTTYNDCKYGESLGNTSKFPRHSLVLKWSDEEAETKLIKIEWSPSRTGLINPVAVFEPVDLEGSTIERASVHNISIVRQLKLGYGDRLNVYKANMIIPQVSANLDRTGTCKIPDSCPICGGPTEINIDGRSFVETLYCRNRCQSSGVSRYSHFVSRDAMNIDGVSDATISDMVEIGLLTEFSDFYDLHAYEDQLSQIDGYGPKKVSNILKSIDKSRSVKLPNLIYALGIPNVGLATAKMICKHFKYDSNKVFLAKENQLMAIDGIGYVIANSFSQYFSEESNVNEFINLYKQLNIVSDDASSGSSMAGITVCVTGSVNIFKSRRDVQNAVESLGGKLTSAVSASTNYLVTNDTTSGSAKNKAAKQLGVEILTEEEFISKFNIRV